jgi:hypothetical protein
MKKDEIKAVEWVRKVRDEQREALKGKSSEQRRAFYRDRARRLHERLGVSKENRQHA